MIILISECNTFYLNIQYNKSSINKEYDCSILTYLWLKIDVDNFVTSRAQNCVNVGLETSFLLVLS